MSTAQTNTDTLNENQQGVSLPQESAVQQDRIQTLKKQLQLTNIQKRQLANNQQIFSFRIQKLNIDGKAKIQADSHNEALLYLNSAEDILEYGASCGKTIDRNLIITTLHNLACVYQRMWQLQKASSYLEGIIFNFSEYIDNQPEFNFNRYLADINSKQYAVLSNFVKKRKNLAFYNLQYCAVSSQLKKNEQALSSARKAFVMLKSICKLGHQFQNMYIKEVAANQHSPKSKSSSLRSSKSPRISKKKDILRSLLGIQITGNQYHSLVRDTKIKMKKYNQRLGMRVDQNIQNELSNFSIANIMQINPVIQENIGQGGIKQEISEISKLYKVLYLSISLFTMATQSRIIAGKKYYIDDIAKRQSEQWRNSQIYHLMAIKIVLAHVPCQTNYLNHILKTFNTHFNLDFNNIQPVQVFSEESSQEQSKSKVESHKSGKNQQTEQKNSLKRTQEISNIELRQRENSIKQGQWMKKSESNFNKSDNSSSLKAIQKQNNQSGSLRLIKKQQDEDFVNASEKFSKYHEMKQSKKPIQPIQPFQHIRQDMGKSQKATSKNKQGLKKKKSKRQLHPLKAKQQIVSRDQSKTKRQSGRNQSKAKNRLRTQQYYQNIDKQPTKVKIHEKESKVKKNKSKSKSKEIIFSNKLHKVTSADKITIKNIYHQGIKPKENLKTQRQYFVSPFEGKIKAKQQIFSPRNQKILSKSSKKSSVAANSKSKQKMKLGNFKASKQFKQRGNMNSKTSRQYLAF